MEGGPPKSVRLSPDPMLATAKKRAAMRNTRIRCQTVVTRQAAVELTGVVTRYWGARPTTSTTNNNVKNNNNNNTHAAHAERFQPSTRHELRKLGHYTSMDTPNTAHQLDAKAVAADVAYTMANT